MKQIFLISLLLGAVTITNAQVTIGAGSMPRATLDIIRHNENETGKAFMLQDGNQGAGKVLTSDANGMGTWKPISLNYIYGITKQGTFRTLPFTTSRLLGQENYIASDFYIDLPPGLWKVDVNMLLALLKITATSTEPTSNDVMWVRSSFTDNLSVLLPTSDIDISVFASLISGSIRGPLFYNLFDEGNPNNNKIAYTVLNGTVAIRNSTNSVKRYYYIIGNTSATVTSPSDQFAVRVCAPSNSENIIVAMPME
jgi:hypothetical protein